MKTKLLILTDNLFLGKTSFDVQDFGYFLFKKDLKLEFAHVCMYSQKVFERFLNNEFPNTELGIVIAQNDKIDQLLALALPHFSGEKKIIMQEGVLLFAEKNALLFLPIESQTKVLLTQALKELGKNKSNLEVKIFGVPTEKVEAYLQTLSDRLNFLVFEKDLDVHICVSLFGMAVSEFIDCLKTEFQNFYAVCGDSLERATYKLLKSKNKTISFAESMTAGKIASSLVQKNEGISSFVKEGLVVYMPTAKQELLDIGDDIIEKYTCESVEMSYELAKNLLKKADTDIALAITGNASGENAGKVFIAIGNQEKINAYKVTVFGNREEIIEKAKNIALFNLIKFLENM